MKFVSVVSLQELAVDAALECAGKLEAQARRHPPDLVFVFASPLYREQYEDIQAVLQHHLRPAHMLGCSAMGIIGAGREVEEQAALSVTAAWLPGVDIQPFYLTDARLPGPDASPHAWEEVVGVPSLRQPHFILLMDPFMGSAEELLSGLDYAYPKSVTIGGLVSGTQAPLEAALYLGPQIYRDGCVGLALSGNIELEALVAQGCRPIGRPMTVTACKNNVLVDLDAGKPLEVVTELFERAGEEEKRLIASALFLGVQMDPLQGPPSKAGDFLIRSVIGRAADNESLVVGTALQKGVMVQFHVRDARAAREDLNQVLGHYARGLSTRSGGPAGALLFSCLGRGAQLFGQPDHDSRAFLHTVGPLPLAGFFCNGEIGPVSGQTYLHSFTSSFGIFKQKQ